MFINKHHIVILYNRLKENVGSPVSSVNKSQTKSGRDFDIYHDYYVYVFVLGLMP